MAWALISVEVYQHAKALVLYSWGLEASLKDPATIRLVEDDPKPNEVDWDTL